MIYYFSGTGNSRYAAEKLAVITNDKCVNIADIFSGKIEKVEGKTDITGFVFPVYYNGLPEMVKRFTSHPEIKSHLGDYIYCVMTCGASSAGADELLAKALDKKVNLSVTLKMPDSYMILFKADEPQKAREKIIAADEKLENIAKAIKLKSEFSQPSFKKKIATALLYPFYGIFRTTKFFKTTSKCNSCGLCERICPEQIISVQGTKPTWTEKKCQHCMACLNRCPKQAIEFGPFSKKNGRYNIVDALKASEEEK